MVWAAIFVVVFIWSAIQPHDRIVWVLEVAPAVMAAAILAVSYSRFPLTPLVYWLILAHCVILMIGGHYTYAEVPAFNLLQDTFELRRNYYDKVGHFAQGFVPALVAREVLIRLSPLSQGKWLVFLVLSVCLAISALYELVEWGVALISATGAEAFLGTQGDEWDTQSDMAMALFGATLALRFLSDIHDRQLHALD
ncbi:MAG: DUF2238 domain-containing protein [Gammaproteobacteria bacterium]|nr:DUF2238 domain-containing protein [Gammaproteobacteria bacterium]